MTEIVHASCHFEYVAFITASRAMRPLNVSRSIAVQNQPPNKLVRDHGARRVVFASYTRESLAKDNNGLIAVFVVLHGP